MEKFKYIGCSLGVAMLFLAGCASQPTAQDEQKKQQEAAIQKKMEEMNATLNEQSEKLKAVESLVEANLWLIVDL